MRPVRARPGPLPCATSCSRRRTSFWRWPACASSSASRSTPRSFCASFRRPIPRDAAARREKARFRRRRPRRPARGDPHARSALHRSVQGVAVTPDPAYGCVTKARDRDPSRGGRRQGERRRVPDDRAGRVAPEPLTIDDSPRGSPDASCSSRSREAGFGHGRAREAPEPFGFRWFVPELLSTARSGATSCSRRSRSRCSRWPRHSSLRW